MKIIAFYFLVINVCLYGQRFEEVSTSVGIDYNYSGNDNQEVGAGVTIIDVNNDGWDDIFQSGGVFPSKLWLNKKGKFTDETESYRLGFLDSLFVQGAASADFDNDGFEDLFIANMGIPAHRGDNAPPVLLKNINGHHFEPVFQDVFNDISNYSGCAWGDVNNDGFVDLYLLGYVEDMENGFDSIGKVVTYVPNCISNKLYLNQGGENFKEVSAEYGVNDFGCGLAACFTDYDNDNDIDLILLNDFGQFNHLGNRLYRNEFPLDSFTDMSTALGFYSEFYGMGVGPGDYDNDGDLDYYLTNIGQNYLFQNDRTHMIQKSLALGVDLSFVRDSLTGTSWSGLFFDVENDGDLDLFVSKGYLNSLVDVVILDENKFFTNLGNGNFQEKSKSVGLNDSLIHRGSAFIDFDHDGDLDIVSSVIKSSRSEFANTNQKIKLYENLSISNNNWIGIKLVGSENVNRSCVGCSITITLKNGKQIKEVDGGSGHSSQSSKILYFGLGEQKQIENTEIQWLGSETTIVPILKAGKTYRIARSARVKNIY